MMNQIMSLREMLGNLEHEPETKEDKSPSRTQSDVLSRLSQKELDLIKFNSGKVPGLEEQINKILK